MRIHQFAGGGLKATDHAHRGDLPLAHLQPGPVNELKIVDDLRFVITLSDGTVFLLRYELKDVQRRDATGTFDSEKISGLPKT